MNPLDSQCDPNESEATSAASEFAQLALWMGANLAGMATAVLILRGPVFRKILDRVTGGKGAKPGAKKPSQRQSLPMLASAIIGSSKQTIESVFGPPRSAAVSGVGVVVRPQMVFWQSDTWYYPLSRPEPIALSINFHDDIAATVEFFTSPQLN